MLYDIVNKARNSKTLFPMSEEDYRFYVENRLNIIKKCIETINDESLLSITNDLNSLMLENVEKLLSLNSDNKVEDDITTLLENFHFVIVINDNCDLNKLENYLKNIDHNIDLTILVNKLSSQILDVVKEYKNLDIVVGNNKLLERLSSITKKYIVINNNVNVEEGKDINYYNVCYKLLENKSDIKQIISNKSYYDYKDNTVGYITYNTYSIVHNYHKYIKESEQKRLNITYPNVHHIKFRLCSGVYSSDFFKDCKSLTNLEDNFINEGYSTVFF